MKARDLRRYCHFAGLSEGALEGIARRLEPVELEAGAVVIEEGTSGDSFYFLLRGEVEVSRRNSLGHRAVLARLTGSETFGSLIEVENPAASAVRAARKMMEILPELNERWRELHDGFTVEIGVGITTGEAFVGNIGSPERME